MTSTSIFTRRSRAISFTELHLGTTATQTQMAWLQTRKCYPPRSVSPFSSPERFGRWIDEHSLLGATAVRIAGLMVFGPSAGCSVGSEQECEDFRNHECRFATIFMGTNTRFADGSHAVPVTLEGGPASCQSRW